MTRTFLLALSLTLVTTGLVAQEPNPHKGKWLAKYESSGKGARREAVLNLKDATGTWEVQTRTKGNACEGLEVPVTVTRATATDFEFRINYSKIMTGCKDNGAKVTRTDDKTFEGEFDDHRKLTLVRQ
jgi:hypothetical protein